MSPTAERTPRRWDRLRGSGPTTTLRRAGWVLLGIVVLVGVVKQATGETPPSYFWQIVLVQVLYAMSVNVLVGYAHLPSLGQAAFFGTGAYTVSLTIAGMPLLMSLAVGTLLAGALALVLGAVAVRTSGITFANVTLALGQMLFLVAANTDLVGGENGKVVLLPEGVSLHQYWLLLVALVVAGCAAIWWVFRTPFGETVVAVRDNAERAESLGVSVYRYRLAVFVFASVLAGLAGALYAVSTGIVTADTLYWARSGEPIIMCLLGGTKRFFGPVVGAVALTALLQQVGQGSSAYLMWIGGILLVVLIVLPHGLLSVPDRIRALRGGRRREVAALETGALG